MKRRDFLKMAAAAPLAAYLPAVAAQQSAPTLGALRFAVGQMRGYQMGPWFAIVHPDQEQELRDLNARERWRYASRAWREAGKPPMSCQQILAEYTPAASIGFPAQSEIGSYEGFRFITSEKVAA